MATQQQRAHALEHANRVRVETAAVCAQIRAAGPRGGARRAAEIVMAGEAPLRFGRLLLAVPRVGERNARWILGQAKVDRMARVSEVGPGRRELIAGELLKHAERWAAS